MNRIKKALEKCRTYVAVQKFGCGHTGIGHGVEDNLLQLLNEAFEELAWLEKREPTLMSDCISAGLPLDVALKYDVQLFRLTNYVRDKALEELKKGPVGELVLVHRKVLNKLGIYDEVINTVAHTPAQQEPVAKVTDVFPTRVEWLREVAVNSLLYAAPVSARREWVDLTDDELKAALEVHQVGLSVRIGRIAIAAFKEKNR